MAQVRFFKSESTEPKLRAFVVNSDYRTDYCNGELAEVAPAPEL
jgi:hypothetical protein